VAKINVLNIEIEIDASEAVGSTKTAMYIYEVAPDRSSSPYHYEYDEEWRLVLDGTLVLRTSDGEQTLEHGDLICFPAGPDRAHKLMNRSKATARVMMFSNSRTPAVSVYPDSDKIGIWPDEDTELFFKRSTTVEREDRWETDV
jgi:uncharacterized cupin superfamily protein